MADLSDVETAMVNGIVAGAYPNGPSGASVLGGLIRVYRGWPLAANLNTDLTAGTTNITVAPGAPIRDALPAYLNDYSDTRLPPSLSCSVSGTTTSFSGGVTEPIMIGFLVDGIPFSFVAKQGDTAAMIAATIATLIGAKRPVAVSGTSVTIAGANSISTRIFTYATRMSLLKRQLVEIVVSVWAASVPMRDAASSLIDPIFGGAPFLKLPDGTMAHIVYASTEVFDQSQNAALFRRNISYRCEYSTVTASSVPAMLFGDVGTNGDSSIA